MNLTCSDSLYSNKGVDLSYSNYFDGKIVITTSKNSVITHTIQKGIDSTESTVQFVLWHFILVIDSISYY